MDGIGKLRWCVLCVWERKLANHSRFLVQNPIPSKAAQVRLPAQKLRDELRRLVLEHGATWSEELERDLPRSWQRHGDLVLLSEDKFRATLWREMGK